MEEIPLRLRYFGVIEDVTPSMVRLMELQNYHCRRPVDTVQGRMFCGRKISGNYGVYCDRCGPALYSARPTK
jgi:hypothetical protein